MPKLTSPARPLESLDYPWYDSVWLSSFQRARRIVGDVAPQRLPEFEDAFQVFRTRPDFEVRFFPEIFDRVTMDEIRHITATLVPTQLEMHEARQFKRFVVHDHPFFNTLQQRTIDLVSEAAGEPVEASYNFLSLYGPQGVCPLHMDAPLAKWTLDLCVNQSVPWPIYFSPLTHWPTPGEYGADWEEKIKGEVGSGFKSFSPMPGEALLFAGSSQWHYRDPMPSGSGKGSSDLLFFHFVPAGTSELVEPANWARLFDIPELAA